MVKPRAKKPAGNWEKPDCAILWPPKGLRHFCRLGNHKKQPDIPWLLLKRILFLVFKKALKAPEDCSQRLSPMPPTASRGTQSPASTWARQLWAASHSLSKT